MMKVSIIVAADENHVIGKDGTLPWRLSTDLKYFKRVTTGHHIVMGRKNHDDIGRALPNRTNVVITRNKSFSSKNCVVVHSLKEALLMAELNYEQEAFIIGGGQIYEAALPYTNKIYLTRVRTQIQGSPGSLIYFPNINESEWKLISQEDHRANEKNEYDFSFLVMERVLIDNKI